MPSWGHSGIHIEIHTQGVFWSGYGVSLRVFGEPSPPQVKFWLRKDLPLCRTCFPGGASGKQCACQCRRHETQVRSLSQEDPLEEGMATHSSILAWRIPWTEEPGGLQSTGLHRVRHAWSDSTCTLSQKLTAPECYSSCVFSVRPHNTSGFIRMWRYWLYTLETCIHSWSQYCGCNSSDSQKIRITNI